MDWNWHNKPEPYTEAKDQIEKVEMKIFRSRSNPFIPCISGSQILKQKLPTKGQHIRCKWSTKQQPEYGRWAF